MAESKRADGARVFHHSINVSECLETRIKRAMELDNQKIFNDFANSALSRKCRQVEMEYGVEQDGP